MSDKSQANYLTHTLLRPEDCNCTPDVYCNICDGGLAFCTVCKGGEIDLEEQSCAERLQEQLAAKDEQIESLEATLADEEDAHQETLQLLQTARDALVRARREARGDGGGGDS